jgi:hypothetical protein
MKFLSLKKQKLREQNALNHFTTNRFHKNLFIDNIFNESLDDDDDYDNDESEYSITNEYQLNNFSMPLTDVFAEFLQGASNERFFINDLSFIFEISRKRVISPYAIILALIYLKRLNIKDKKQFESKAPSSSLNPPDSSRKSNSNTELGLITIVSILFIIN